MDKWQELTIEVNREVEEAASNILIESGSQGVAIDEDVYKRQALAQLGERLLCTQEVSGSIPLGSIESQDSSIVH